jgi:hypothetical protein
MSALAYDDAPLPEPSRLELLAAELEREKPDGLTQARRISAALDAIAVDAAEQAKSKPPALGEEAWCHRCGYPKAGHGTWATCGGWL